MLKISCPHCGVRPELEFRYAGQAHLVRPSNPQDVSDEAWTKYLHERRNPRGGHFERWRHLHGCGRFFNAVRDTLTDRFLSTYPIGTKPENAGP